MTPTARVSDNFRKMTYKAIAAIIFFILVYLLLILGSIGFIILSGFAGLSLLSVSVNGITLMVGAGLVSIGVLVIIFLFKFMFKKYTNDLSHLREITREDQPQLFAFIQDIVTEVKTDFPKKIYISSDVNAAVFYDSSFWSMFFPIKKNLQIGLGLVNVSTVNEFKAILAHEFGHFSQRTMKVGSYVYNVNQIIHNMLYDNESFEDLASRWAGINQYFNFFVGLAMHILRGIQWVLRKVYNLVNLSYMGLSREMEFHADEVAACLAGSQPLVTSLLRLDIAEHAYQSSISYYEERVAASVLTENIYENQKLVLSFLSKENKLPLTNDLPEVSLDYLRKLEKSKLVIKDQWASHPATKDRVKHLQQLNIPDKHPDNRHANVLFDNLGELQELLTAKIFESVNYEGTKSFETSGHFIENFSKDFLERKFDDLYHGYYDDREIGKTDIDLLIKNPSPASDLSVLFAPGKISLSNAETGLDGDISTLTYIENGVYDIKTFDYDGTKYTREETGELIKKLNEQLSLIRENLAKNNDQIFCFFYNLAILQSKEKILYGKYLTLIQKNEDLDRKYLIYTNMVDHSQFMHTVTQFEAIKTGIKDLRPYEEKFRQEISDFMAASGPYQIPEDYQKTLSDYTSNNWEYFDGENYHNDQAENLFTCLNIFRFLIFDELYYLKKDLLDFQASLYKNAQLSA